MSTAPVELTVFPKCCACCGQPLYRVQKMYSSWFECRKSDCLVNLLEEQELEEAGHGRKKET